MRILVDIGHPAHVHFFKHPIRRWNEDGHRVKITARQKDVALDLLDHYKMEYTVLSAAAHTQLGLLAEFLTREWKLGEVIRKFRPDVITAISGGFISPAGKIAGVPTVVFEDSEHVRLDRLLTFPLASAVYTPECFRGSAGPNHKRYRGFQEMAYLHPDYFKPNPAVLEDLGLYPGDRFALLRFIAWKAGHDVGQSGFSTEQKMRLVEALSKKMRVFISIEGAVPQELKTYLIDIRPDQVHDLLYYASLYVGEGATMATESALLGTPAVYISSLVGTMGNFIELNRLKLVESYLDGEKGIQRALEILNDPSAKEKQKELSTKLFQDNVDVTELISRVVINQAKSNKNSLLL